VYHPRFEADAAWEALARRGISHLPAVPTTLERLLTAAPDARPESRAPALRQIVYGGAPCPPGLIPRLRAAFPGMRLFQGFGQTETGYCLGLHDADHDRRPESLGRPDLFGEIRLLDESGHEAPPGEPGEIVARTPYLMTRYWNDPAATTEYFRFGPDWGRTDDLAWRDGEGFYFLAGRKSELIITGGVNVYPAEVERVLLSHPAVREAAVFGTLHADWGEAVTAAVILRPHPPSPLRLRSGQASPPWWRGDARQGGGEGSEDIEASLLDHCRRHLAPFKVPKVLRILDEFPRTASGKVKKKELAKQP
jgi:acyl-CoA synthetase (AMP-forming)/AMP-acid ligase II